MSTHDAGIMGATDWSISEWEGGGGCVDVVASCDNHYPTLELAYYQSAVTTPAFILTLSRKKG